MKKSIPIHTFLFGVYPFLFLYSYNISSLTLGEVFKYILASMVIILVLWLLLSFILKNRLKAGLFLTLVLLLFFSYGHVITALELTAIGKHNIFLPAYLLIFIASILLIYRMDKHLETLTSIFNVMATVLVVMSLVNIGVYRIRQRDVAGSGGAETQSEEDSLPVSGASGKQLPDIYYIILDSYPSAATLVDFYEYDNHEFIDKLQGEGFYVASESRSNYTLTFLSLASSLNMDYIDNLSGAIDSKSNDREIPYEMIRDSQVQNFLKLQGYSYVHFKSGWGPTDLNNEYADLNVPCGRGNEFSMVLAKTTILKALLEIFNLLADDARERTLCTFDKLAEVQHVVEGPRFVFAHLLVPHPPYLFGPSGDPAVTVELDMSGDIWKQQKLYIDQLIFVNQKVEELVDALLTGSDFPPIIIIQGDHGSASTGGWDQPGEGLIRERTGILNAYYLPDDGPHPLYDSLTPVNTFRLIFDQQFGTSYGLLDDRVYFSNYERPYLLTDVTDMVRGE